MNCRECHTLIPAWADHELAARDLEVIERLAKKPKGKITTKGRQERDKR